MDRSQEETQLLTRNRYRITGVLRKPPALGFPGVSCRLKINDGNALLLTLTAEEFHDLTLDLGLRPTSPDATEYESTTMDQHRKDESEQWALYQRTLGQMTTLDPGRPEPLHGYPPLKITAARFAGRERGHLLDPTGCELDDDEIAALQVRLGLGQVTLEPHDRPWGEFTAILETTDGYFYHVAFAEEER